MKKNPYTLIFGREPMQMISRPLQSAVVLDAFIGEESVQQIYMVTGVRGSGKTVFMTEVSKKIRSMDDWVVVELNPDRDMLNSLAAKLCSENSLAAIFKNAKINLSFFGFGMEINGSAPITDIEFALSKMLESLKRQGKKVLVTIDEVVNSPEMKVFASAFQIFIRQELPLFLLMTGLYENIRELQDEKTLTFLYRTPKIELNPLNLGAIARNYRETLRIDDEKAKRMADLTRGYSFAFQVLGYFVWENGGDLDGSIGDFRQYLEEFVYEKIWSELSFGDRRVASGIAASKTGKISEIREYLKMETNQFNPYRMRLIRKGLVNGEERGYVRFVLPLFEKFVLEQAEWSF